MSLLLGGFLGPGEGEYEKSGTRREIFVYLGRKMLMLTLGFR